MYQPSRRSRLIALTESLIILDIKKTECYSCFITHCFEENTCSLTNTPLHRKEFDIALGNRALRVGNLEISHESASR